MPSYTWKTDNPKRSHLSGEPGHYARPQLKIKPKLPNTAGIPHLHYLLNTYH